MDHSSVVTIDCQCQNRIEVGLTLSLSDYILKMISFFLEVLLELLLFSVMFLLICDCICINQPSRGIYNFPL